MEIFGDYLVTFTIETSYLGDVYLPTLFTECVEQMVLNMRLKDEISPTLRIIVDKFDENNRRPSELQFSDQKSAEEYDASYNCDIGIDGEEYGNCTSWSDDHDDLTVTADLGSNDAEDSSFPSYPQVLLCIDYIIIYTPILDKLLKDID